MKLTLAFLVVGLAMAFGSTTPTLRQVPLAFEANRGQFEPGASFGAAGDALRLGISAHAIRFYKLHSSRPSLKMSWTSRTAQVDGEALLPGTVNYLVGNDSSGWRTAIPTFRRVRIRSIAPGVDLVLYGKDDEIEYDLELAPGADVNSIVFTFTGARRLRRSTAGSLIAECEGFAVEQRRPEIYQELGGRRLPVTGSYVLRGKHMAGFQLASYNKTKPLVIDPVLAFSTVFGGSGIDSAKAIALDAAGNIYVAGDTSSADFPVASAYQWALPGQLVGNSRHIFVTKLDSTGSTVLFSTYLGGSAGESARAIAVDSSGNVYIAGSTVSADYPVTAGTLRSTGSGNGSNDIVLTKLAPSGGALVYSAVIGGVADDEVSALAVDASGNCFLTGATGSVDFPVTAGARNDISRLDSMASGAKAFVMKVNSSATALSYSAVIGGSGVDQGTGIAIDSSGNAYLSGTTSSSDFPVTGDGFQISSGISAGASKGFVAQLSPDGTTLVFATYLGGTGSEQTSGIALDNARNIYITGVTTSSDFPGARAAYFKPYEGAANAVFVAKLNPSGTSLTYSALFGGANNTVAGIAVDEAGRAVVAGSTDFGLSVSQAAQSYPGSLASGKPGATNAFALKLNAAGSDVVFSTYLGGTAARATAVASDTSSATVVTGSGDSMFPITPGAYTSPAAGQVFLAKISDSSTCTYSVQASSLTVNVATQTGCRWIAVSAAPWLSVVSGRSGSGSGAVQLSAQQNTGVARSGQVSVAGSAVTITQASGCQFNLSASAQAFGSGAGSDQITAFTQTGCPLPTASANVGWIHMTSAEGVSPYTYLVDSNSSGQVRSGHITIGSQIFTVTQYASPCSFSVAPASLIALSGNPNIISVTSSYPGCAWTASTGSSGLSLSPIQGQGSATIVVNPASVSGDTALSVTANVAGRAVSILIPGRGVTFGFINKLSGKALDLTSTTAGARTQQMPYSWAAGQQWELIPSGDGYYFIRNAQSGNMLQVAGASTANAASIDQGLSTGTDDQKWQLILTGDAYYRIVNKLSGKVVDIAGSSPADGAPLIQSDYVGGNSQQFRLAPSTQIPITANAPGASVTISGSACPAGTYPIPSTVFASFGGACTLSVATPSGYAFGLWADGLTTNSRTITASAVSVPVHAVFTRCSVSLSAGASSLGNSAAAGNFTITTQTGCAWSLNSGIHSWLAISPSSGSGTAIVSFNAAANNDLPRAAALSIAGQKFTIRQAGRVFPRVFRPGNQNWYLFENYSNIVTTTWGESGDIPISGDFDGDGKADVAIWRPTDGMWWTFSLPTISVSMKQWGLWGDVPVPADYDGDSKTDFAVYRPANGTWYIIPSTNPAAIITQQWGLWGDTPEPGDYDGDGKTDLAVWRPASGTWWIIPSSNPGAAFTRQWGLWGDIPVPADYDGDGKTDFAVYRPANSVWYIVPSTNPGTAIVQQWGLWNDIPVPGDFDGDGKADFAIWRPSDGMWWVIPSSNPAAAFGQQWGLPGDMPILTRR